MLAWKQREMDSVHDVNLEFRFLTYNANLGVEVWAFRNYYTPEAESRLKRCGSSCRIFWHYFCEFLVNQY